MNDQRFDELVESIIMESERGIIGSLLVHKDELFNFNTPKMIKILNGLCLLHQFITVHQIKILFELAEYLIKKGVDPFFKDNNGETPISLSSKSKNKLWLKFYTEEIDMYANRGEIKYSDAEIKEINEIKQYYSERIKLRKEKNILKLKREQHKALVKQNVDKLYRQQQNMLYKMNPENEAPLIKQMKKIIAETEPEKLLDKVVRLIQN